MSCVVQHIYPPRKLCWIKSGEHSASKCHLEKINQPGQCIWQYTKEYGFPKSLAYERRYNSTVREQGSPWNIKKWLLFKILMQ